jgi:uncharacterized protein
VHVDLWVAVAGAVVGFVVGLTGMGGGALMTPILVLVFRIQPLAAVSSDLVASFVMKPVGGGVHLRRGTVNRSLVGWLVAGSVPCAFLGVLLLRALGDGQAVEDRLELLLGAALLMASTSMVVKAVLAAKRLRAGQAVRGGGANAITVRPVPTLLVGALGGLIVGMTSVGSGSLIIVMLLLLYPTLRASELVGTDLVQAVPLVGSAALGHVLFGDFEMALTTSLLVGALPGVYLGARVSSKAPDGVIRPALVVVLVMSGLKLVGVPTEALGFVLAGMVLLGLPLWGVIDAASRSKAAFAAAGEDRRTWIRRQAFLAPVGAGAVAAVYYLAGPRRRVAAAVAAPY